MSTRLQHSYYDSPTVVRGRRFSLLQRLVTRPLRRLFRMSLQAEAEVAQVERVHRKDKCPRCAIEKRTAGRRRREKERRHGQQK